MHWAGNTSYDNEMQTEHRANGEYSVINGSIQLNSKALDKKCFLKK